MLTKFSVCFQSLYAGGQEPNPNTVHLEALAGRRLQGVLASSFPPGLTSPASSRNTHRSFLIVVVLFVASADHGGLRLPQSAAKIYEHGREAAKLDIRVGPQVLRRTLNTLMLRAGVDRITLRAILGHSSEKNDSALCRAGHEGQGGGDPKGVWRGGIGGVNLDTLMIHAVVDRFTLRAFLGHSSEVMTERYAGLGMKEAIMKVFWGEGMKVGD